MDAIRTSPPQRQFLSQLEDRGVRFFASETDDAPLPQDRVALALQRGHSVHVRDADAATRISSLDELQTLAALYVPGPLSLPLVDCLRTLAEAGLRPRAYAPRGGVVPVHRLDAYRTLTTEPDKSVSFHGLALMGATGSSLYRLYAVEYFKLDGPDRGLLDAPLAERLRALEKEGYTFQIYNDGGDVCGESALGIYDRWATHPEAPVNMQSKGRIKFPVDRAMMDDPRRIKAREEEVQALYRDIFVPYGKTNACFWSGRAQEVIIPAYRSFPSAPPAEAVRGMCDMWDYVTAKQSGPQPGLEAVKHLKFADSLRPAWMSLGTAGTMLRALLEHAPQDRACETLTALLADARDDGSFERVAPQIVSLSPYFRNAEDARQCVDRLMRQPADDVEACGDVLRSFMAAGETPIAALSHLEKLFGDRPAGQTVQDAARLYHRIEDTLRPLGQERHSAEVFYALQQMVLEPPWRERGAEAACDNFVQNLPLRRDALDALARTRAWRPPEQAGKVQRDEGFVVINGVRVRVRLPADGNDRGRHDAKMIT